MLVQLLVPRTTHKHKQHQQTHINTDTTTNFSAGTPAADSNKKTIAGQRSFYNLLQSWGKYRSSPPSRRTTRDLLLLLTTMCANGTSATRNARSTATMLARNIWSINCRTSQVAAVQPASNSSHSFSDCSPPLRWALASSFSQPKESPHRPTTATPLLAPLARRKRRLLRSLRSCRP
jgi:hypothetical protein